MKHRNSSHVRRLAAAGLLAALGLAGPVLAQSPIFPDPALQPGYERSPQTTALNQSMLDQIERNPGAPMAGGPIAVQPGATVTYPPRLQQAPFPPLTPQPQR